MEATTPAGARPPSPPRWRAAPSLATLLTFALALGCSGDPNDPRTWAKKLKDLRDRKEALDRIASMDVEKARPVLPDLVALYEETRAPEHLSALVRYKDPSTKPLFVNALSYTDEDVERAVIAAGALGEMKATDAVEPLVAAAERPTAVKSKANAARLAAIRALVKIGDPRAVPAFTKILTTSADEQDFLLNQKAALGLAELRDPQSIPALIKGLFMTGRQINVFQECRLALVRIGAPAVDPLVALLEEKDPQIREMAKRLKFDEYSPGVVPHKAAIVLGDLRAAKAVPALVRRLRAPKKGAEQAAVAIALGMIGTPPAVDAVMETAQNAKAEPALRASAANALYLSGDRRALPVLLALARSGYVTGPDGGKASDLRASAAIDFARLAGPDEFAAFKTLVDAETEVQGIFGEALDRMQVARDCGADVGCYGKQLEDSSWTRAEKAAFAIGFSGDAAKGIPLLLGALKPLASLPQERFPVHQAILYGLTRLGTKSCAECEEKLLKQIDRDEGAARLPGARALLGETRVALAVIQNNDTPRPASTGGVALASAAPDAAGANQGKGARKGAAGKAKAEAKKGAKGRKR